MPEGRMARGGTALASVAANPCQGLPLQTLNGINYNELISSSALQGFFENSKK
jgi:hypothetical protein